MILGMALATVVCLVWATLVACCVAGARAETRLRDDVENCIEELRIA